MRYDFPMEEKRKPGRPPTVEGPKVGLSLRIRPELKAAMLTAASRYGEDLTAFIERAIRAELKRIERRERRTEG